MPRVYFEDKKPRVEREIVLVTEGVDDAEIIDLALAHLNADPSKVGLVHSGGKGNLLPFGKTLAKTGAITSGTIRRIVLLRDADDSVAAAEAESVDFFAALGMGAPNLGTVSAQTPSTGLYLFPDALSVGNLEDLCIPSLNPMRLAHVNTMIVAVENSLGALQDRSKRICQAYLAASDTQLCSGIGRGARNGALSITSPVFQPFLNFLSLAIAPLP